MREDDDLSFKSVEGFRRGNPDDGAAVKGDRTGKFARAPLRLRRICRDNGPIIAVAGRVFLDRVTGIFLELPVRH
jgi:hypothetical protein